MAAGVADKVWDVRDIVVLIETLEAPATKRGPYRKRLLEMYKHARGGYRDISPDKPKKPLPRSYWRRFYYSAIAQDTKLGKSFARHHRSAPDWLKEEVKSFGPVKWLSYWSRATGSPKQVKKRRVKNSVSG